MEVTPKKCIDNVSGNAGQFSPVIVPKSPVSKATQNLTGNPRFVRDLVLDVHANIQQWNAIHLRGLSTLKTILQTKVDETSSDALQNLCDVLEDDCNTLDEIVQNFKQFAHRMKAIGLLDKSTEVIFLTWPIKSFENATQKIYEAYRDEAVVKRKVLENIAQDHRESWKTLHLTAWIHQPYIYDRLTTILEAMLVETGLREF